MTAVDERIKHVVVLMMENRSFDNMLGHLTVDGRTDVDGVTPRLSNKHDGRTFRVRPSRKTKLERDPPHGPRLIDKAVADGKMSGFVSAYAEEHPDDPDPGVVMRYHTAEQLPVYSHLADQFCVCDRWFSSVPGSTWPNRLYAVAGRAAGSRANRGRRSTTCRRSFATSMPPGSRGAGTGTTRGTLRAIDREGKLPAVSWIDPNFVDLQVPFDRTLSNDDHPPSDVRAGQQLVLELYNAVARGPAWNRTLLIVTYDEHGGFFDHVPPPPAKDDDPEFRRCGVRVPALVVSPWVAKRSVAPRDPTFEHASIIKTLLERFCRPPDGTPPRMTRRVEAAASLWPLLTERKARPAPAQADRRASRAGGGPAAQRVHPATHHGLQAPARGRVRLRRAAGGGHRHRRAPARLGAAGEQGVSEL
ncbi:MAG: alkaline phosphatase family protein [Thermoleophilaceae bacterium]